MSNYPRISIGVPHPGTVLSVHFFSYLALALYESSKVPDDPDIKKRRHLGSILESPGCYVGMNRSVICGKFKEEKEVTGSTHLLMIDTDISFTSDLLDRIVAHLMAFPEVHILAGRVNLANGYPVFYREEYGTQVMQIQPFYGVKEFDLIGTGMIIISREVIDKMRVDHGPSIFNHIVEPVTLPDGKSEPRESGDDFSFCKRAKKSGFKIFGAWDLFGLHHKILPVPQGYPDRIVNLAPSIKVTQ